MNNLLIQTLNRHGHYNEQVKKPEGDAGIDLFFPNDVRVPARQSLLVDFEILCEMVYKSVGVPRHTKNVSYMLVPRSSISKTPLRMCNSIGLIDAGYRGEIMAAVDNVKTVSHEIKTGERLFQLVALDGSKISFSLVDELTSSERGDGGFGSTGK